MLREDLQRLKKSVEGRTVFILGGGPSVTPSVLEKLNEQNKLVFCLNSSAKFIKNPCGLLWCDDSWAATNEKLVFGLSCPKFFVRTNGQAYIRSGIYGFGKSTILHKISDFGAAADINEVCGNNSGAYAINLLINCNAATINLIGFDMKADKNIAHFHKEYTYAIRPSVYSNMFIPSINSLADAMKKVGNKTKVYNCNPHSELKCFPFKGIEDVL